MAFLLLFTSSGMTMDVHFCQGKFKRANLFGKAKTCAEVNACLKKCGKKTNSCSSSTSSCSADGDHKNCCNNEAFQLDFDFDSGQSDVIQFNDIEVKFVVAFATIFGFDNNYLSLCHIHQKYVPPILESDVTTLFQILLL